MKKTTISILLVLTLMFTAFICGMYVGRNSPYAQLQLQSSAMQSSSPETSSNASSGPEQIPTSSVSVFPININTATAETLQLLPEIGPARAQAIIEYRAQIGQFKSLDDLLQVNGIGEKILDKITPYITLGG